MKWRKKYVWQCDISTVKHCRITIICHSRKVDQFFVRRSFLNRIAAHFRSVYRQFRQVAFFPLGKYVVDQPITGRWIGKKRVMTLFNFFHAFFRQHILGFWFDFLVYDFFHVRTGLTKYLCEHTCQLQHTYIILTIFI